MAYTDNGQLLSIIIIYLLPSVFVSRSVNQFHAASTPPIQCTEHDFVA